MRHFTRAHTRSLLTVTAMFICAASVAAAATFNKHPLRRLTIVVSPTGSAIVHVRPGNLSCTRRCVMRFRRQVRLRLTVTAHDGARFAGWSGACSGRTACVFRLKRSERVTARFVAQEAPPPPPASLGSWNSHVNCGAVATSLPALLGALVSGAGGALESGGAFQPHLRGDTQRHLLNPPCALGKEPTFVQIDGLVVGRDWGPVHGDGDYTGTLADPQAPAITNAFMKAIHAEIDATWIKAGVAPAHLSAAGSKVDVQGFVYWDPGHVGERFHNYSGWELHPLTAWRTSSGSSNPARARAAIAPAGAPAPYRLEEDENGG